MQSKHLLNRARYYFAFLIALCLGLHLPCKLRVEHESMPISGNALKIEHGLGRFVHHFQVLVNSTEAVTFYMKCRFKYSCLVALFDSINMKMVEPTLTGVSKHPSGTMFLTTSSLLVGQMFHGNLKPLRLSSSAKFMVRDSTVSFCRPEPAIKSV